MKYNNYENIESNKEMYELIYDRIVEMANYDDDYDNDIVEITNSIEKLKGLADVNEDLKNDYDFTSDLSDEVSTLCEIEFIKYIREELQSKSKNEFVEKFAENRPYLMEDYYGPAYDILQDWDQDWSEYVEIDNGYGFYSKLYELMNGSEREIMEVIEKNEKAETEDDVLLVHTYESDEPNLDDIKEYFF